MRPSPRLMMQATKALRSAGHPDPKNGVYVVVLSSLIRIDRSQLTTLCIQIYGMVG